MNDSLPQSLRNGHELVFTAPGHDHLWQSLYDANPEETAGRAQAAWLGECDFLVEMLGENYYFNGREKRIVGPENRLPPDRRAALSLLNYLVGAKDGGLSGQLVTETVLPGGDRFFSGTHALSRKPILDAYGRDGAALLNNAARLGAKIIDSAAESFSFSLFLLPKIFVQVTLCQEDEEFPADLYFAIDPVAADHVPLAIVGSLVGLLNDQLASWR